MTRIVIHCGPPAVVKQPLLARYREIRRAGPLDAALWLAPNYRAVEAIRPLLTDDSTAGPPPVLLTLHELADAVVHAHDPDARPISQAQCRLLTEEVLSSLAAAGQ